MPHPAGHLFVSTADSLREALRVIDSGGCELALVVDEDERLVGTLTDGDVRRALLAGVSLDDSLKPYLSSSPLTADPTLPREAVIDLMQAHAITQVPIVDEANRVVGLHLLRQLLGREARPNLAVIMAGGRGTRLGPLTEVVPKPMVHVAGRPILERLVLHLVGSGIESIAISVNHLADQIESHFGDGDRFGCRITYLREEPDRPLGTAGSLSLLRAQGLDPEEPMIVLNGDLVTQFSVRDLLEAHDADGSSATVAVRRYSHQVPFGVLDVAADGTVRGIEEKPVEEWWTSAGIYVLDPTLVDRLEPGAPCDLPTLLAEEVAAGGRVQVWSLDDDWHDVGRPDDLRRAQGR